jgi:hypothetical protein
VLLIPALTIYTKGEMEIQLNLNFTPYDFPRYQQKRSVAVPLFTGMGIFMALGMGQPELGQQFICTKSSPEKSMMISIGWQTPWRRYNNRLPPWLRLFCRTIGPSNCSWLKKVELAFFWAKSAAAIPTSLAWLKGR